MALVWLMIYFSICLMIIVLKWYFEITFVSLKKGLCWPSFWDYFLFDIRSAQSLKAIFYALRFEMIYDFHLQMRGQNFRTQNYFRQEMKRYFIDENASIITIFVHSFLRKALCPYPCVEINFLRKETVCYVRF